jgi:hypothetical protein
MRYVRRITADAKGVVTAEVRDVAQGRECGRRYWMYRMFFETNAALERRLERANKWADERVTILEEGEKP